MNDQQTELPLTEDGTDIDCKANKKPGNRRKRKRRKRKPVNEVRTSRRARRVQVIDYFSIAEAASILGVTYQTVRQWIRRGKLESIKIGHLWRIHARALLPPGERVDGTHMDKEAVVWAKRLLANYLRQKGNYHMILTREGTLRKV